MTVFGSIFGMPGLTFVGVIFSAITMVVMAIWVIHIAFNDEGFVRPVVKIFIVDFIGIVVLGILHAVFGGIQFSGMVVMTIVASIFTLGVGGGTRLAQVTEKKRQVTRLVLVCASILAIMLLFFLAAPRAEKFAQIPSINGNPALDDEVRRVASETANQTFTGMVGELVKQAGKSAQLAQASATKADASYQQSEGAVKGAVTGVQQLQTQVTRLQGEVDQLKQELDADKK